MKNNTLSDFFSSSTEFSAIDHFLQLMVKTNTFDQMLDVLQANLSQTEQDNHQLQETIFNLVQKEKRYEQDIKSLTLKFSTKIADLERKESTYQQDIKSLKQQFNTKIADLESRENKYRQEIDQLRQKIKQQVENTKTENVQSSQRPKTQTIHSNNELEQGVWTDPKTGLMWARISIGQEWKNNKIVGSPKWIDWRKGSHLCETLKLAGYNDWRLPTINELATLMSANRKGYVNENILSQSGSKLGFYWSSSSTQYSGIQGVDFDKGIIITYNHLQFDGLIRAVRNSKIG
ncbi:DUF1566 domain-containing protein [Acinetobacter beijerinckii]|uniref:Lcl C-terminal domain-containing protein n=2 Tax=Acinetobacter TaxID=469 RepID=R9B3J9_9GAMM|nr:MULTISPECIES: DUF1566 domain-containing protein [Acinetobacter]EOR08830.1 hypothetical protein F896_01360 [Acinetobacter genomosp. 15BJ]ESK53547.1 hypothetical protein F990_03327 [Acinetobacter tjernbergiae DSM 14971 = CIP 107465]